MFEKIERINVREKVKRNRLQPYITVQKIIDFTIVLTLCLVVSFAETIISWFV